MFIQRRRAIAKLYKEKLYDQVMHPIENDGKMHIYSRYVIRTPFSPFELKKKLREQNIVCEMMYLPPLHRRTLVKNFIDVGNFPKTDEILNSSISLPIYPSLTEERVLHVIDNLNKCLKEFK